MSRRLVCVMLVFAGAALSGPPRAAEATGDRFLASTLYAACTHAVKGTKEEDEFLEQTCISYLRGLTDALFVMQTLVNQGTRTCMPAQDAIWIADARRIFEEYLLKHPEKSNNSAGLVASFAILDTYKCQR